MKSNLKTSTSDLRRQRTRTLVQLGGLIQKAELLPHFNLKTGDDLQTNEALQENVAELFGALLEIKSMIRHKDHSTILWQQRGKEGLAS
ncbi:MAG: conjugal transfer protein TraD [bacterium]|nr:conjugal transfer protein TraD [bacterium]